MEDYTVKNEIGKGSFATVFKATHKATGQLVAIKAVNRKKLNRKLAENLEKEIEILTAARHRNVVKLYTVIKTESEIHLVMEFCDLGDLSLFIKKQGAVQPFNTKNVGGPWGGLGEFVVRYLLGQLGSAIEFLRVNRIIHRDLKPQNILLSMPRTNESVVYMKNKLVQTKHVDIGLAILPILKLGDFGFARALESQSLASTLCGSPLYMAPEILKGEKYDAKTDLWSVGGILYEMITGKPPFRAQNHIELLRKIEKGDGRIIFPDESPEVSSSFRTREYHGGIQRNPLAYRKSSVPSANTHMMGMHIGSLGSSPKFHVLQKSFKPPSIPDDLKDVVRRLLKRNPVERMSFEEFFIHPAVQTSHLLNSQIEEEEVSPIHSASTGQGFAPSNLLMKSDTLDQKSVSSGKHSHVESDSNPAPFPGYHADPNWADKVLEAEGMPRLLREVKSTVDTGPTETINEKESAKLDSPSSFGSSLGSYEFSSEEGINSPTKKKAPEALPVPKIPDYDLVSSGDYVVVEKGAVEVKWMAPPINSVHQKHEKNIDDRKSSDIKDTSMHNIESEHDLDFGRLVFRPLAVAKPVENAAIQSALVFTGDKESKLLAASTASKTSMTVAKQNVSQGPVPSHQKTSLGNEMTIEAIFNHANLGPLPFLLPSPSPKDNKELDELLLSILRALSVHKVAQSYYEEFSSISTKVDSRTQSEVTQLEETLSLLVYTLGLYQYSMNKSKDLYRSFNTDTTPIAEIISTVSGYISIQFSNLMSKADEIRSFFKDTVAGSSRAPQRIIYDTSLQFSRTGAMRELQKQDCFEYYKTSVLMLQALLQTPWDVSEEVMPDEDVVMIREVLDSVMQRFASVYFGGSQT